MANQGDKSRIIFSPATHERHEAAFEAVAGDVVTRNPRKGISRFPGIAPGAWGLLAAGDTIAASSGGVLGGGQVKLCDKEGVPYDEAAGPIPVLNAGSEITAEGGPRIVALEWTAGDWSVCGCGGAPPEPTCGESCGTCEGAEYILPGLVDGAHPVGKAASVAVWTDPGYVTSPPPSSGVLNAGFNYSTYDEDLNPIDSGNPVLYFYAVRCELDGIWLDVYFNATEVQSGSGEWAQLSPVVQSGYFAREVTTFDSDIPDNAPCEVVSCEGGTIELAYELPYWTIFADPPVPLTGTVTLTKASGSHARMCCEPCWMAKTDKVITVGVTPITLVYDALRERWSGGNYSLACTAGLIELGRVEGSGPETGSGSGVEWTLDEDNSTCSPLHLVFTRPVGAPVYIDEA